jgi:hypothetical protein
MASIVIVAIASEATNSIFSFSEYELFLKRTLIFFLFIQFATIIWITTSEEMEDYIKKIRLGIVLFFLSYLIHSLLILKANLNDSLVIGLIFLPGFLLTFLNLKVHFPKKQKSETPERRKQFLVANGYDVSHPIIKHDNGDMKLRKQVTPQYFLDIEVDKNFNKINNYMCSMEH